MAPLRWCVILVVAAAGCAGGDGAEDGADDVAIDGKADNGTYDESSPLACAMRKLASTGSTDELASAKVPSRSLRALLDARSGGDSLLGTQDDIYFDSLAQLDAVKYVGPITFKRLADATADARWACGMAKVQLLAFNDFHGNLAPPSGSSGTIATGPDPATSSVPAGGGEFLAAHLNRLRLRNPNTLVVAAGDLIGATPLLSAAFHDEPSVEAMAGFGLDVAAVGNHEFDKGIDELWRMQWGGCHPVDGCYSDRIFPGGAFDYLAANVIDDSSGETIFAPLSVRRFGGVRIAFIGATLEGTPTVTTASGVKGLHFENEAETVNRLVPALKADGIQAIVLLIHEGGAQTGLYNECTEASGKIFEIAQQLDPAVSVIVSGHTHKAYACTVDGRLITSAAHAGRLITDIDLEIDERTGAITHSAAQNVIVTRDVPKDPVLGELIARWTERVAPIANRIVATITADIPASHNDAGESPLGDLVADAQLAAAKEAGAVAAFMNPGGIRADLVAAQISGGEQPGQVTFGEVFSVQPFSNLLVTFDVTGDQLKTMFEQQWQLIGNTEKANILQISANVRYAWDKDQPLGSRIDAASISIDGVPVDPTRTYRIVANAFLADGGDNFLVLKQGTNRATGSIDIDAFQRYLESHTPLSPPALSRITRKR